MLAIDGKFDFAVKTNPFGSHKKQDPEKKKMIDAQREKFLLYRMDARHKAKK